MTTTSFAAPPPHVVVIGPRASGKTRFIDAVANSPKEGAWSEPPDDRKYRATIGFETRVIGFEDSFNVCVTEVADMNDRSCNFNLRHAGVLCYVCDCRKSDAATVADDLVALLARQQSENMPGVTIKAIAVVAVYHLSVEGTASADEADIAHIASILESVNSKLDDYKKHTIAQSYLLNTVRPSNARMIFDELVAVYAHRRQQQEMNDDDGEETKKEELSAETRGEEEKRTCWCIPIRRRYRKIQDDRSTTTIAREEARNER